MSEEVILQSLVVYQINAFLDKVNNKTFEELGGQDGLNDILIQEIVNIYIFLQTFAAVFEQFATIQNSNWENVDKSFESQGEAINIIAENMNLQNEAFNKALNSSITRLSSQMTNQNKVLDKQVIKLSKSISKITGEQ